MGKLSCTLWLILCVFPQLALANSQFNMRKGVTDISENVYELHMTIFFICCVIGIIVFAIMLWALIHHRKSKGAVQAQFHESTKVEILWTAIPFVILIAMAVPATKTLIAMEDASKADLTIKVTGSQWKWHYEYMGEDVEFYSMLATPQDEITNLADKNPNYLPVDHQRHVAQHPCLQASRHRSGAIRRWRGCWLRVGMRPMTSG